MASSSQRPPAQAEEERERPRLTEEEKKANHIASEQKRRQAIREGFDRLTLLVPGLEGQARSEGIVLHGTVDYIRKLMLERRAMIEALEAKGVAVDPDLKISLEMLPVGWLDGGSAQGNGAARPDNSGDTRNHQQQAREWQPRGRERARDGEGA